MVIEWVTVGKIYPSGQCPFKQHLFNPKRIMRGCGPRKTSMDDPAAIILTQEPIFHLIIHNIGPLCYAA